MIYVECNSDYALVKSVTHTSKKEFNHAANKGKICNQLRKQRNCKGLVDEDPLSSQPGYMKEARLENDLREHEIKVLHDDRNNYLIVLCPRLEEWILRAASEAGIDVRKYNLPNDAAKLHQEININLDKFAKLLEDMKDSRRLKTLKRLLEEKQ